MNVSIRTTLIVLLAVLTTVSVSLTGYLSFRNGRIAVNEAVAQLRSEISRQIQSRLRAQLEIPVLINRANASAIAQGLLSENDPKAMERFFLSQIERQESVSSIYFGNTLGGLADAGREGTDGFLYVIATDDFKAGPFRKYAVDDSGGRGELLLTVPDFDARTRPWYAAARETGVSAWSDAYVLFTGQDMAVAASQPVYGDNGQFLGVTATDIFLSRINDYLKDLSIGRTGEAFILEPSGKLIATSTDEHLFVGAEEGGWRRMFLGESHNPVARAADSAMDTIIGDLSGIDTPLPFDFEYDGRRFFAEVTPFDRERGPDWRTLVVVPESDFMAPINENTYWTIGLILATLLLAIGTGIFGSRWITAPLVRLNRVTRELSRGEKGAVAPGSRVREINELSSTFNTMSGEMNRLLEGLRNEVAERENVENELRRAAARYRSVVDNIREIVFQLDTAGHWMFLNPAWEESTGYTVEEALGESFLDYVHLDLRNQESREFHRLIGRELDAYKGETRIVHRDGDVRWMEVYARPILDDQGAVTGASGTLTDVTERKNVDMAMRRMQKMEAIGRLSGGLAHDFNNLLAIILGHLDHLARHADIDDAARHSLDSIRKSARRAEKLTRQLLGFSRRQATQTRICDVNRIVREMENLLARSLTPRIELNLRLAADLWTTRIDPGDFEDALLNLAINARDAMPGGGELVIETCNRTLDEAFIGQEPAARLGKHIEVAVTDTGVGVPLEDLERVFEPFFTTKPRNKGTGLGLAMVYGFVKRSGGFARVDSLPGRGTRVSLFLPRVEGEAENAPAAGEVVDALPGGDESILVVDDEEELCELARATLADLGYNVSTAANGTEALARLADNPDIDLLFTDVVMPGGMSGHDLAEAATTAYPRLRVLLTSGYTDLAVSSLNTRRVHAELLRKPYSPAELAGRVRATLDMPSN